MSIAHEPTERLIAAVLAGDLPPWPFADDAAAVDRVLAACRDEGLGPLIHHQLERRHRRPDWPDRVLAALAADAQVNAAWDLLREREIVAVLGRLRQAGIESVLLKGTPLAYTHYPEPALRTRSDTDIFIRSTDRSRAADLMRAAGYTRVHGVAGELVSYQESFHRSDAQIDHIFDLHWRINNGQVFAQAVPFEEALANSVAVPALGAGARTLSAPYALLLACMHRAAHIGVDGPASERSIWLYDVKLLARAMAEGEWARFAELCAAKGMRAISADALQAAGRVLGTTVPESVATALEASEEREASAVYLRGTSRAILFADLRALPTWRARVALVREMSFPSAAYMFAKYGTERRWLLPWLYLRRIGTGVARSLGAAR
jgi:hypothetical protein